MDALQQVQEFRNKIEALNGEIKALRGRIILNDTLHQEREKELLRAISKANRVIKRQDKQLESYRLDKERIHLKEIVRNQGFKILKLNKKINDYEMEKL